MGTRGPQKLPAHLKRSHRIGVWLNEVELEDLGERLGLPGLRDLVMVGSKDERKAMRRASEYMRARALGRRVRLSVPEVNREAFLELGRIGNNINQIAAQLNARTLNTKDRETLAGIFADLAELRPRLVGLRDSMALDDLDEDDQDSELGMLVD